MWERRQPRGKKRNLSYTSTCLLDATSRFQTYPRTRVETPKATSAENVPKYNAHHSLPKAE